MSVTVFYADVLGFSNLSALPSAAAAAEALSDIAHILSTDHALAQYLQRPLWRQRYALSDSMFLVGRDPVAASAAAAEFFFNLAYYNASQDRPVLMRGAITFGQVRRTKPIFPESGKANLIGEAVVRAVQLEGSGVKGPRLLVSSEVVKLLKKSRLKWLVDKRPGCPDEVLWLLPPEGTAADGLMIADVAAVAVRLALAAESEAVDQYAAYVDLVVRSLLRLRERFPEAANVCVEGARIGKLEPRLKHVLSLLPDHGRESRAALVKLLG